MHIENFFEIQKIELAYALAETWKDLPYWEGLHELAREFKSASPCCLWEILFDGVRYAIDQKTALLLEINETCAEYTISLLYGENYTSHFMDMTHLDVHKSPLLRAWWEEPDEPGKYHISADCVSTRNDFSEQFSGTTKDLISDDLLWEEFNSTMLFDFRNYDDMKPSIDELVADMEEAQRSPKRFFFEEATSEEEAAALKLVARFYELGLKLGKKWAKEINVDVKIRKIRKSMN